MPRRTTTRTAATLTAVATAALVLGFAPVATAATSTPTCIGTSTAVGTGAVSTSSAADKKAAIAAITKCIAGLADQADKAGRVAEKADEKYLTAKKAAATAAVNAQRAADRATAAAVKAQQSRQRAAAVAAYMARTGQSDQATSVMLDGKSASKTLYGLSRVSQLTVDSTQIARQAAVDSDTAKLYGELAAAALTDATAQEASAKSDYQDAKKSAAAAALLASQQLSQAQALAAQYGVNLDGSSSVKISVNLPADASKAQKVVAFARAQIGDPYVFAAAGPNAWDCSGLTMGAYASVGIGIGGHSATAQYDLARSEGKLVPYADAQPGDLIFYTDGGGDMYHVTIYSGNGMMIEAPQAGEDVREVKVRTYQIVGMVARFTA